MFSNLKKLISAKFLKTDEEAGFAEIRGLIGKGMGIEGSLFFDGTVRIDGHLKGEVTSAGTLLVGEEALIEGQINIGATVISGEIRGVIDAKDKIELRSPAKVFGDLKTPTLIIGEGVIFDGNCIMTKKEGQTEIRAAKEAGA